MCAERFEVGGIMLFNQIIGLTNQHAKGIVQGYPFFLEINKVQPWN